MKSIKTMAVISMLAMILSIGMYALINSHMASIAAVGQGEGGIDGRDRQLCERLIRFGQVAYDRGQFAEAKHFYQKAIVVDPTHTLAWKKYNIALIALISAKVETDPGFLPEFSVHHGEAQSSPPTKTDNADADGC